MRYRSFAVIVLIAGIAGCAFASGSEKVLYAFTDQLDGGTPVPGVILDKDGNVYGASAPAACTYPGNVFELTPSGSGWSELNLYEFTGNGDGGCPQSGLIFDPAGRLYGTTADGGDGQGWGVVYGLEHTGDHWTESVYYQFNGETDGGYPMGGVTLDSKGNLFGTTFMRGDPVANVGVVYKLSRQPDGEWIYQVLHTFEGSSQKDGASPKAAPLVDSSGNIYGTAYQGGSNPHCTDGNGCGVIYKLSPAHGGWNYHILYNFGDGVDGAYPWSQLVADSVGNLYGTTEGGGLHGFGTVFELSPTQSGRWKETVLHSFNGTDGRYPWTGVTFGPDGDLYGVTNQGGSGNQGVVFRLAQTGNGWQATVMYNFTGHNDGGAPQDTGGVAVDAAGNVYGTTYSGGLYGAGVVFEVSP
jgi:uncharacterized repeat protein (TIGR03803 family)